MLSNRSPRSATAMFIAMAMVGSMAPQLAAESVLPLAAPLVDSVEQSSSQPQRLIDIFRVPPARDLASSIVAEPDRIREIEDWNAAGKQPMRTGLVRELANPVVFRSAFDAGAQVARPHADGYLVASGRGGVTWAVSVQVDGASRIRLHLADVQLPETTELWVYSRGVEVVPFDLSLLRSEGDLWTPSVEGPEIRLEVRLPGGSLERRSEPAFVIDSFAEEPGSLGAETTVACVEDAACYDNGDLPLLDLYKKAVAHLAWIQGPFINVCSGALLNDMVGSFTPYLLTANHCFSTQSVTSTVEAYFDYIANSCLGSWPNLSGLPRTTGGTLLATGTASDFSFVRLPSAPGNRAFLGWTTVAPSSNTTLYRLSHPWPDDLAQPGAMAFSTTRVLGSPSMCTGVPNSRYIYSSKGIGSTTGGSSGAPSVTSNLQVVGQLFGVCGFDTNDNCDPLNDQVDGRFSQTYPSISQYLDPATPTVCISSSTVSCLLNDRFRVTGTMVHGTTGQTLPMTVMSFGGERAESSSTVFFESFIPGGVEFVFKMLDACSFSGSFWGFLSGTLTNLETTFLVEDTLSGQSRIYTNGPGQIATGFQDTDFFRTCNF